MKFSPFCKSSCRQEIFRPKKSRQSRWEPDEKRICVDHNDLKLLRVSFCGSLAGESETFYPVNFAYSLCRLGLSKNERILRPEILLAAGSFGEKREYGAPARICRCIQELFSPVSSWRFAAAVPPCGGTGRPFPSVPSGNPVLLLCRLPGQRFCPPPPRCAFDGR